MINTLQSACTSIRQGGHSRKSDTFTATQAVTALNRLTPLSTPQHLLMHVAPKHAPAHMICRWQHSAGAHGRSCCKVRMRLTCCCPPPLLPSTITKSLSRAIGGYITLCVACCEAAAVVDTDCQNQCGPAALPAASLPVAAVQSSPAVCGPTVMGSLASLEPL